ncbi:MULTISPECIES: putative quinol monooxygenase [Aquimarina]|uniref:putative quinol monooxygenase n=1 Tax=Aquimarina TaxID=290174 RepID=UPI000D68CD5A|nr:MULTISPECIES: antibiotic biosynthesis monooxygenase [Aquimarina]
MKIMVKIELVAQPENTEKVHHFFKRILPDTRDYKGCESAKISRFPMEPYKFILIEHWESSQHYLDYGEWRNRTGDFKILRSMLFSEIDLQILEVLTDA